MIIGNRDDKQMLSAVRKLCGHVSRGPSFDLEKSVSAIRRCIIPWFATRHDLTNDLVITLRLCARVVDRRGSRRAVALGAPQRT